LIAAVLYVTSFWLTFVVNRKLSTTRWGNVFAYGIIAILTFTYWLWEKHISEKQVDIRIDLIAIYAFLFGIYWIVLWPKLKWKALLFSTLGMCVNILYFILINN